MDVHYQFEGERFVWDSNKAFENEQKHRITFELAAQVFVDPLVVYGDAGVPSESRQSAIGMTLESDILFVVHLVREGSAIRIISARTATSREVKNYENYE